MQVFVHRLQKHLAEFFELYADLSDYLASVSPPSTIPTELSISLSRPDWSCMVSKDSIYLFELTIPTNTQQHLLAARAWKVDMALLYDLQRTGFVVDLISTD